MEVRTKEFNKGARAAIENPQIQSNLKRLYTHFHLARQTAVDATHNWEDLRSRAKEIKEHTINNLDYYLELLEQSVLARGGKVYFAKDAKAANNYVLKLARSQGVKLVTKGKSMVSEEMGINHVLAKAGIESVETDLGEYIIQLAQETPFHIVAPAIHKSKEEVSDLFVEKAGTPRYNTIQELTEAARGLLRDKFIKADMGITGVNFAVAETGTIAIVTNEGNGRLCTSLPKIHVALMGMEKVIPSLEDLGLFLRLLVRAATGQPITAYTTFVTGPKREDDEDGPEEFHLVIVDNGRSKILRDPDLRESLYCIRCGACLNACPVYRTVGGHAYGWVYPGPIGMIVTPMMTGLSKAKDLPFASTLCGACREVCPIKINIPRMLLKLRSELIEGHTYPSEKRRPFVESLLFKGWYMAMRSPVMLGLASKMGRALQRPLMRKGRIRRLPFLLSGWTKYRDFPSLSGQPFRMRWKKSHEKQGDK